MDTQESIDLALSQLHKRCKHAIAPPAHLATHELYAHGGAAGAIPGDNETSRDARVSAALQRAVRNAQSDTTCLQRVENLAAWKARIDDGVHRGSALAANIREVEEQLSGLENITMSIREESEHLSSGASALMFQKSRLERLFEQTKATLMKFQKVDELANEVANPHLSANSARFSAMIDEIDDLSDFLARCKSFKSAGLFASKLSLAHQRASMCLRETIAGEFNIAVGNIMVSPAYRSLFQDPSNVPIHTISQGTPGSGSAESGTLDHHPEFSAALSRINTAWLNGIEKSVPLRRMLEARAASVDDTDAAEVLTAYRECRIRLLAPVLSDYVAAAYAALEASRDLRAFSNIALAHFAELAVAESALHEAVWLRDDFCGANAAKLLAEVADSLYSSFRSSLLRLDDVEQLSFVCANLIKRRDAHAAVVALAKKMAEDSQERLIFRASIDIRYKVQNCAPTTADLERLCTAPERAGEIDALRNCVFLLELLYTAVDRHVFGILAEECVHSILSVIQRMERTARGVTVVQPAALNAELIILHHLLALRAHVNRFDAPLSSVEMSIDVSQLAQRKLAIIQSSREAKRDIEAELKHACERVVRVATELSVAALSTVKSPDDLAAAEAASSTCLQRVEELLVYYVHTPSTIAVLMRPIKLAVEKALDEKQIGRAHV